MRSSSSGSDGRLAPRSGERVRRRRGVGRVINLYSPTSHERKVLFVMEWFGRGTHTIRIVNKRTPGRPKIDVDADAFLVYR